MVRSLADRTFQFWHWPIARPSAAAWPPRRRTCGGILSASHRVPRGRGERVARGELGGGALLAYFPVSSQNVKTQFSAPWRCILIFLSLKLYWCGLKFNKEFHLKNHCEHSSNEFIFYENRPKKLPENCPDFWGRLWVCGGFFPKKEKNGRPPPLRWPARCFFGAREFLKMIKKS